MSNAVTNIDKLRTFSPFIDVTRSPYGAKGDGSTDDYAAIQAAVDAIDAGIVFLPPGRYKVSQPIEINKPGVTLRGAAPVGQGGVTGNAISEIFSAGATHVIRYGDPAEASAYGSHIYPGGGIECLAITGSVSTTSGIRIYNVTVHIRDCYISNVVNAGGIGLWMKASWLSSVQNTVIQSNAAYDLYLDTACNSVLLLNDTFLSTNTSDGLHIVGGSNTIIGMNLDFEGKANGISIDTSSATLENLQLIGINCESNATNGIIATGAQPINGLSIQGYRGSGAGNGITLNYYNAMSLEQVFLHDCDLNLNQVAQDGEVGRIYLTGAAAITGQATSLRKRRINATLYEDNATVGALAYTLDAALYTELQLNLTAACTNVTFTIDNTSSRVAGEELQLMIGNSTTASVGGAVTLPAAFKKSAALVIPASGARTIVKFVRDQNNIWWESTRVTDIS